ncbi:MAG: hypothetical protein JWO80_533, partial [Bryobacterales bacterium]|nr:hypothetical protein [Bryobacterales bacterium]
MLKAMRCWKITLFFTAALYAQETASPSGKWISNLKYFENDNYDRLQLELNGTKLTGKLGNDSFECSFQNGRVEGQVKPNAKTTIKLEGFVAGNRFNGTAL